MCTGNSLGHQKLCLSKYLQFAQKFHMFTNGLIRLRVSPAQVFLTVTDLQQAKQ